MEQRLQGLQKEADAHVQFCWLFQLDNRRLSWCRLPDNFIRIKFSTSLVSSRLIVQIQSHLFATREILKSFGTASGLRIKYTKSSVTLISGEAHDAALVSDLLQCPIAEFPIKYLGLQLALWPMTKAEWQPARDKFLECIPSWQHGMVAREGR